MAIPNRNQIYIPESSKEILDQIIDDYRLAMIDAGIEDPAVYPGTEPYIRFNAIANAILALMANLEIQAANANEKTATGGYLDDIREAIGLEEKVASGGSGLITPSLIGSSAVLFTDGLEFVTDLGLRGKINGNQTITTGDNLEVIMIDTGLNTNLVEDDVVRFVNPPINCLTEAIVYSTFSGGSDDEIDNQKRNRILDRRRNPPGGGNWSQLKELAESVSTAIQAAFVYPCLGGPGSAKVVVQRAIDYTSDYTADKEIPDYIIEDITAAIQTSFPTPYDIMVQSVENDTENVAIDITIPTATEGNGWNNITPFPKLINGSGDGYDYAKNVGYDPDNNQIVIRAWSSTVPTNGVTEISTFGSDGKIHTAIITAYTLSEGNKWTLTLDNILGFDNLNPVFPAFTNSEEYCLSFLEQMDLLGPGENTSEPCKIANDRALRYPLSSSGQWRNEITQRHLLALQDSFPEIIELDYRYRPIGGPAVPASVNDPPVIYVIRKLGFYPKA
jgi:uncharacterized phage protein gp47/JayE